MNIPEDLRYTESHEWVRIADGVATVGITDHAQEELSELVYAELPDADRIVEKGEEVAVIDSTKTSSDIYTPVSGTIAETNPLVVDEPGTINKDPYGAGWMFKVKIDDESELETLLDADGYKKSIG